TKSVPLSVSAWLKVRLRVLKARLAYPLDEVLARIDQRLLHDGPMSEASTRDLLTHLNARLDELRNGGREHRQLRFRACWNTARTVQALHTDLFPIVSKTQLSHHCNLLVEPAIQVEWQA